MSILLGPAVDYLSAQVASHGRIKDRFSPNLFFIRAKSPPIRPTYLSNVLNTLAFH